MLGLVNEFGGWGLIAKSMMSRRCLHAIAGCKHCKSVNQKTSPPSPFGQGPPVLPRRQVELKSTHRGHPIGPTIFAR